MKFQFLKLCKIISLTILAFCAVIPPAFSIEPPGSVNARSKKNRFIKPQQDKEFAIPSVIYSMTAPEEAKGHAVIDSSNLGALSAFPTGEADEGGSSNPHEDVMTPKK